MEIVEDKFHFNKQRLPLHPEQLDEEGKVVTVWVNRPEEKGTDVALASHLLLDGLEGRADSFAVVTNDSDLMPPMRMLAERGRSLALVSVAGPNYNKAFDVVGLDSVRQIRRGTLRASQFAPRIVDAQGRGIKKPQSWP